MNWFLLVIYWLFTRSIIRTDKTTENQLKSSEQRKCQGYVFHGKDQRRCVRMLALDHISCVLYTTENSPNYLTLLFCNRFSGAASAIFQQMVYAEEHPISYNLWCVTAVFQILFQWRVTRKIARPSLDMAWSAFLSPNFFLHICTPSPHSFCSQFWDP